ncbi:FAD synthetase domain protein, partial [Candidatus Magnetoovum chiemensis]
MKIIKGLENVKDLGSNSVLTLGNFDGVHIGHQRIFKRVKKAADDINGISIAITFDPHPVR